MSNAVISVGTKFYKETASASLPYTPIAEITAIDGPSVSRDTIDVTSLDSTGGYKEYVPGFRDSGEISLTMNFTATTYEIMLDDFESDNLINYKIETPDGSTWTFAGYITELSLSASTGDKITSNVTIKISGPVTYTGPDTP